MSLVQKKGPVLFETKKKGVMIPQKMLMLNDLSSWENHSLVLRRIEFDRG